MNDAGRRREFVGGGVRARGAARSKRCKAYLGGRPNVYGIAQSAA
jgi:hypothetical protein